jgi:glycosyltransferase involved in cell wall biosynthesis
MACAVPVIATSVGLFPQIIGADNVDLLIAPNDHAGLAERLVWWLTRPEAGIERGLRLRQRVIREYGAQQSVDAYESILIRSAANAQDQLAQRYMYQAN